MQEANVRDYLRIDAIQAENFRCFRELKVELNSDTRRVCADGKEIEVGPLTVIVAKNGMGKSSTLDAIRIALGTFTSAFDYPSPVHIAKADIRIAPTGESPSGALALPVSVRATGMVRAHQETWGRALLKEEGRTTTKDARCISDFGMGLKQAMRMDGNNPDILPLVVYYGTARLWKEHKETDKGKPLAKPRDFGYAYCLDGNSNYKSVYRWITDALWAELTAQQVALAKDVASKQLQAIRNALGTLLEREGYLNRLHFNAYFKELAIVQVNTDGTGEQNGISVPISALSDGVRAIFSMVVDIAFRCAKLNPQLGESACAQTPGIVLIDEIDQHLHPAWQQTVLDTLQTAFPLLQFIVTTHSPQVISSVPKGCVRVIENGEVVPFDTPTQGVEIGDILRGIFGTHEVAQNSEIAKKLDKLHAILAEGLGETAEWEALYGELEAYYGKDYGPLLGAKDHRDFLQTMRSGAHDA